MRRPVTICLTRYYKQDKKHINCDRLHRSGSKETVKKYMRLPTFLVLGNLKPRQLVSMTAGFFSGLGAAGGGGDARVRGEGEAGVAGDSRGGPLLSSADVAWFDAPLLLRPRVRRLKQITEDKSAQS